jgi:hypothetical protein
MLYAVQWAQQTTQTQQTIVAQELFTSWFGIKFDGTGALLAESATAWAVVTGKRCCILKGKEKSY